MKFFFAVTAGNLALQDRKTSREQRRALFQSSKRNADPVMFGAYAPNSCIKAPPLCATHLKKVDENFNLSNPQSVRNGGRNFSAAYCLSRWRVKPLLRNHLSRSARERLPVLKLCGGCGGAFSKASPSRSPRIRVIYKKHYLQNAYYMI